MMSSSVNCAANGIQQRREQLATYIHSHQLGRNAAHTEVQRLGCRAIIAWLGGWDSWAVSPGFGPLH